MAKHQEDQFFPELKIKPEQTNNLEYRRCFKICVNDFKNSYLEQQESECVCKFIKSQENCLSKYLETSNFLSLKMMHQLTQMIQQDPKLKRAFNKT